jgi:hypothetical protein
VSKATGRYGLVPNFREHFAPLTSYLRRRHRFQQTSSLDVLWRMSPSGRYCCKSRKSSDPENLAKVDLWTFPPLRRFSTPLRGAWSILDETIWSLTSPRVKRISGFGNFRSPPQKDFCNNICHVRTSANAHRRVVSYRRTFTAAVSRAPSHSTTQRPGRSPMHSHTIR